MRRVVIAGMYAPYTGPFDGVEVWGLNRTYVHQMNMARVYFLDSLASYAETPEFVDKLNGLGVPVYCQRHYEEIPLSREFPLEEVVTTLGGRAYFTSTIAYMIAHAIYEGAGEITLHRLLVSQASAEYMTQKSCLDYWCGIAIGRGIQLRISEDSDLCRPVPWEPALYGYEHNARFWDCNNMIVSSFRAALRIPAQMVSGRD